ncbi:SIS domain-containing protein [uncultured Thomasclavelia sp.]|uniref:MurR/RpiR family transcriptional regulator n=1 Tax=uncultured Thomasclavelia sp. TaxID=3025759 RepID=UPI0034599C51
MHTFTPKNINANFPFQKNTNLSHISNAIAKLYKESIDETLQLINEDILRKSVILLDNAKVIDIYGVSGPLRIASDFQYKMFRIGKDVRIAPMVNEQLFQAAQSKADHCAILVSYSGETEEVIKAMSLS